VKYAVAGLAIEIRGEPSKHFSIEVFLTIMAADFMRFGWVVACGVRSCGENGKAVSFIHFLTWKTGLQAQGWLVYTRAQLDYIYLRLRLEVFDLVYKASILYGALLYHWNSLSNQVQQVVKIEVLIQVPLLTL
jgi:hypothetical protein